MADVWSTVAELEPSMQSRLAEVLETRGADVQQRAMRANFLDSVPFPEGARVLDVGCGTGVLTRTLAVRPGIGEVVGVDPASSLLDKARELAGGLANISFLEGDARSLPVEENGFDVVVFDSTLSHVPGVDQALSEAFRALKTPGWLAAFDGDYATTTVALDDHDPLQECVRAMMAQSVNDRYLMRRLPGLVQQSGFEVDQFQSHGFLDTSGDGYMMTVVDRGIDILSTSGQISAETSEALRAEVQRRAREGIFFGHIAYASLVARKPG